MSAALKYTLGRLGLFVLVAVALLPLRLNLLVTLMIALLVSMVLSYLLLRKWREEFAVQIADGARRRRKQKEQLRAALAGDESEVKNAPRDGAPSPSESTSDIFGDQSGERTHKDDRGS